MKSTACSVYQVVSIGWCSGVTRSISTCRSPELQRKFTESLRTFGVELPHVIRVHQSTGLVESPGRRTRIRLITDVPFPENGRSVSCTLQHFSHGRELWVQSPCPWRMRAENFRSAWIASRQQSRTRRRADCLRDVEVVVRAALACKTLDVGSWIIRLAERSKIGPTRVVKEDDYEIWKLLRLSGRPLVRRESDSGSPQKISSAGIHRNVKIISRT